ncbi:MAG: hypothetical protein KJ983_03480, partial [Candidatus Omnitrophica bacterium]|nr:hypothetical protein [Candidatus Omnitrophota bacterium]
GHEKEYQKLCEEAEKAIGKLEDKGEKARQKADVATFKDALQRISPYDYANLFSFTEAVEDMAKNEYPFYFGSSQDKEDKKVIKALVEAKTDYIDRNTQTVLYLGKLSNIDSVSRKEKTKIFSHFYDESHRCFKRGMYSYAIMALKKAESVYPGSKRVLRMAERIGSAQEELRKVLGEAEKALVDVKKALEKVRVNEDVLANAEIALQNAQEQETNLEKIEKGEINWGEIQKAQRVLEKPRKDLENAKSELGKDKYKATGLLETTKKVLTKLSQRDSSGNLEVKGILATINDYENQLAGNVIVPAGVGLEKPVFASAGNLLTSRPFGYQGRLGDSRLAKLFQSLQGLVGLIAPWASVSKLRLKYGVMEANALFSGRMATEYETDEQVMDDVLAKSAEKDTLILVVNDGKKRNYLHIDLPSLAAKAAKTIPGMENVVNEKGDLPIMTGSVEWQEEEIDSETWLLKPSEDKLSYGIVLPIHLNQAEVGLTLPINKDGKVVPAYMKVLRKGVGGYNKVASDIKIERIIAGRVGSPTDRFRSDKANLDMARAIYSWVNEVFPGNRMAEKGLKKITEEKIRQNISPSLGVISVADFLNKHKFVFTSTSEDIHKEAMNQYNKMTNAKDESEAWLSLANKFFHVYLTTLDNQGDAGQKLCKSAEEYFLKSAEKAANVFFEQGSIHKGISGFEEALTYGRHAVTTAVSIYFPEWGLCSGFVMDGFVSASQHNLEDHKVQEILSGEYLDGHVTSKSVGTRALNEFPEFLQRQVWVVNETAKEFEQTGQKGIWQKFINTLAAYPTKTDVVNLKDK